MVKNVRRSASQPHPPARHRAAPLEHGPQDSEEDVPRLLERLDAIDRKATDIWRDIGLGGGARPGEERSERYGSQAAGAASWDRKEESLNRIDKTSAAQRNPGQSVSSTTTVDEAQLPSPPPLPTLGICRDSAKQRSDHAKPKSLYEAFNEGVGATAPHQESRTLIDQFQRSLFENFTERLSLEERLQALLGQDDSPAPRKSSAVKAPEEYTQPFIDFLTENPTVFHAVDYFERKLENAGFKKLSEREDWSDILVPSGKYFVSRNGSALIAFTVGKKYRPGNGVAMIGGHIDALTAKVKPVSNKRTTAGYVQLGVAPYAGALNSTWWDRDLGIGGKVLMREAGTGKTVTKLVKLGWPIARIPTLAPHFGRGMTGNQNKETETVPIIGLDNSDLSSQEDIKNYTLGAEGSFSSTQSPRLVRAIAKELGISDYSTIVNWELELYDIQPAQTGGFDKEFVFGGRIDDKLCSWAALEALLASSATTATGDDSIIKLVALFDDEEIGSLLYQGAKGNFLPATVERVVETFTGSYSANTISRTYANSFLVSADVTHAVNPNFVGAYLEDHAPRLNVGLVVTADSNGHMTTTSVSTALLSRIAEKNGDKLQMFMIRNDSRSGGTIGPALSSALGVRAIDAGIPQLSMHSIRATTGSLDPGLGVKTFAGFFEHFESVDKEFE